MKVNETKKMALNLTASTFQKSKAGIRFTKENLNALNTFDNEESRSEEENNSDPRMYLNWKEERLFNRLPVRNQKYYVERAEQEVALKNKRHRQVEKSKSLNSQAYLSAHVKASRNGREKRGKGQGQKMNKTYSFIYRSEQSTKSDSKIWHMKDKSPTEAKMANSTMAGPPAGEAANRTINAGGAAAQTTVKSAVVGTSTAAGAATGGASVAVQATAGVGKKAAELFRDSLLEKSAVAEQRVNQIYKEMEQKKEDNSGLKTAKQVVTYTGAAVVGMIFAALQVAISFFSGIIGILAAIIIAIILVVTVVTAVVSVIMAIFTSNSYIGAERIVEVALTQEGNTDGSKYWEYTMGTAFVDGSSTPWCASFVSWCANECGFIDEGAVPKSGSVATYRRFYAEKELLHEENDYIPQTGDLILFGNDEHIGIVQYVEGDRVITIEGNTDDAVYSRSYSLDSDYITGYCSPEYPGGNEITIPEGMGTYHTYMGWHTITSTTSRQYQLREASGENYDAEGFAKIGDRYVIACTLTFGEVGDYIDFYRENGDVIHAVIGDIKNSNDPGCNEYGHANGQCVVEYIVSSSWYPSHANPGTANCHPEWDSRIVKAVNLGTNYFD